MFQANRDQKKAGVANLISNKIDFKIKAMKRDREGHYIMIKGPIQEEDITIINISSVQFSLSVVSDSLRPHESQHTRPPYPSPTSRVHSNSRPSSR